MIRKSSVQLPLGREEYFVPTLHPPSDAGETGLPAREPAPRELPDHRRFSGGKRCGWVYGEKARAFSRNQCGFVSAGAIFRRDSLSRQSFPPLLRRFSGDVESFNTTRPLSTKIFKINLKVLAGVRDNSLS